MKPFRLAKSLWQTGLMLAMVFSQEAGAAADCYDQTPYPAALRIVPQGNDGFVIYLPSPDLDKAGKTLQERYDKGGPVVRSDIPYTYPAIAYRSAAGFTLEKPLTCHFDLDCAAAPFKLPTCPSGMPSFKRLIDDVRRVEPSLFKAPADAPPSFVEEEENVEQGYGACSVRGDSVWFGIRFYEGEGYTSIGGLGRYDKKSKRLEIRRPEFLRHSSIFHIHHDGERLWMATGGDHECTGTPPTLGLVGYDWKTHQALTFVDDKDGPCGFLVNGFAQLGDDMWVATDLGLSRWNRKTSTWQNYLPAPGETPPMRETRCSDLYQHLIETLPRSGWNEAQSAASPYHQFMETLARLRPRAIDANTLARFSLSAHFPKRDAPGREAYRHGEYARAFREISAQAQEHEVHAEYNLGILYAKGYGVKHDFAQALLWLDKAARRGHADAQLALGLLLLNRAASPDEWQQAQGWIAKAAAKKKRGAENAWQLLKHAKPPRFPLGDRQGSAE